jgi:hypothetical protein
MKFSDICDAIHWKLWHSLFETLSVTERRLSSSTSLETSSLSIWTMFTGWTEKGLRRDA